MQTLILDLTEAPPETYLAKPDLDSFPGILLEGLNIWQRVTYQSWDALLAVCEQFKPDIVVLVGESALSHKWSRFFEQLCPKLFSFAHPDAETEAIMEFLIQRTALIRQKRLATQDRVPDISSSCQLNQLFSRLVGQTMRDKARAYSQELITNYKLESLMNQLDSDAFERGLRLVAMQENYWGHLPLTSKLQALDIGCHSWSYAPFLKAFYAKHSKARSKAKLTGLELDPWYLQNDGFSRHQWAHYYASLCQAKYLNGHLAEQTLPAQHFITWLMPIIMPVNALRWGIPQNDHQPLMMLTQLRNLLAPGGQLLIFNGVELEFNLTLSLLRQMQWKPIVQEAYACPLKQRNSGYVIVLEN